MPIVPQMSIDRAFDHFPKGPEYNSIFSILIDDAYGNGLYPKYDHLKTVGSVLNAGISELTAIGLSQSEAEWLIQNCGGKTPPVTSSAQIIASPTQVIEQSNKKRGWPKGKPRKPKAEGFTAGR